MGQYARITPGSTVPEVIPMERPFSNFDFIEDRFAGVGPLRRIMSQCRQLGAKTMVLERLEGARDLNQENKDIAKRYPGESLSSEAYRIGFFSEKFSEQDAIASITNEEFLGYAILKTDTVGCRRIGRVYESVIRASGHENNCIRGAQEWECVIAGSSFAVRGYLYAQQNTITNCCAHVALRTAASRYHQNGDMSYHEMNDVVGINHKSILAEDGLDQNQMVAVLEAAGARCFVGDYTKPIPNAGRPPFQKYLYGSIESGFPAIVIFGTADQQYHAIPIFGHTFGEDTWVHKAEASYFKVGTQTRYIPSESWVSMYIGHDDNWGSNFCIPRQYLQAPPYCDQQIQKPALCAMQQSGVAYAIATMPSKVKVDPITAETKGAGYLFSILEHVSSHDTTWTDRLVYYAKQHLLVLRPILIDGEKYLDHLRRIRDWDSRSIPDHWLDALPALLGKEWLWMIELSVPELFSANRRKIGEVLLHAEQEPSSEQDFKDFVLARLPHDFAFYAGGEASNPNYEFYQSGIGGHVELYGCEDN